ncbi:VOC family protein [Microbacterium tumbae]
MTVIQQIVYTEHPQRWWRLAEALGFIAPYPPAPEWGEFHGDGVLAVHRAFDDRAAGASDIHVLVDDLDAAAVALAAFDATRSEMAGVGELLTVRAASGIGVTVSAGSGGTSGSISVQPIWFQPGLGESRAILEALGLRAGIVADRGGWAELHADGGSIGLHEGESRIGLGFETRDDVDVLSARLRDAGFEASVVDEAYARTVRIADPDGAAEIWVNGVQDDLHGYHRVG